jgi:hypothetical protein
MKTTGKYLSKRHQTDKGMHILRFMADGVTVRSCNTHDIDMQEVLLSLPQPAQPMIVNASNGLLAFGDLHHFMDDHKLRQYHITRDNFAEKADRSQKFTGANFQRAARLHQLPILTMQRAATVNQLALQKQWQGENLVKGERTLTEPRCQWFCDECNCVDLQDYWLAHCK